MKWAEAWPTAEARARELGPLVPLLRKAAAHLYAPQPTGLYWSADSHRLAVFGGRPVDQARLLKAANHVGPVQERPLLRIEVLFHPWVKAGYSPVLNSAGQALNFFEGHYPGGVPNHASPLAAMLTTGLVGGGLGWGLGRLGKAILPEEYGENLPRTGALMGGLMGLAPGALWGVGRQLQGKPLGESWLSSGAQPGPQPPLGRPPVHLSDQDLLGVVRGSPEYHVPSFLPYAVPQPEPPVRPPMGFGKRGEETIGSPAPPVTDPLAVSVDAMGQTLWRTGAPPQIQMLALGALQAAQRMPDPAAQPGWATGRQLAQLAANAGQDYVTGMAVGGALNALVGTPWRPSQYGGGLAAAGLIGAVVSKLFGR